MSKMKLIARLRLGPQPRFDEEVDEDDGFTWVSHKPSLTVRPQEKEACDSVWVLVMLEKEYRAQRNVFPVVFFSHSAADACAGNLIHNECLQTIDIVCVQTTDARAALALIRKFIDELNDRLIYKADDADSRKEEAKHRNNRARAAMANSRD